MTAQENILAFLRERAKLPSVHPDLITGLRAGRSGEPVMLTATDLHVVCELASALTSYAPLAAQQIEDTMRASIAEALKSDAPLVADDSDESTTMSNESPRLVCTCRGGPHGGYTCPGCRA